MKRAPADAHWLQAVAIEAGLAGSRDLALSHRVEAPEAWVTVSRACGIGADELARLVAAGFSLEVADLERRDSQAVTLVPEKVARRYLVFPLRQDDKTITIATCDPTNIESEQAIAFASGRHPVFAIAPPEALREACDDSYAPDRAAESVLTRLGADWIEEVRVLREGAPELVSTEDVEGGPIVRLTNLILTDAIRLGASDVHLEPGRGGGAIRLRVDGVMRSHLQIPMAVLNRVISRVKVLGGMDISDRLRPQDGRSRVEAQGRAIDLRISTVPSREAEKAVIRVLDTQGGRQLVDLELPQDELRRFRRLLAHRDGIVVVTGPTGSGKTTTLYAALCEVANGELNVMTVEDPVEYELSGITQIQVDPKRDITFASALRSILRQDPDVIFVGEIRDLETAEMAIQASMTGHLVLATMHTNSAVGAVARLVDLGLDRFKVAATLRGVLAQRLMRRTCQSCSATLRVEQAAAAEGGALEQENPPSGRPGGCSRCAWSGYRGRRPVVEILTSNVELESMIHRGVPAPELRAVAENAGLRPLREAAMDLVRSGETTLSELERVIGEPENEESLAEADRAGEGRRGTEPHILLVEDDPVSLATASSILAKSGFTVCECVNGEQALGRLRGRSSFGLVVLDLQLPGKDGRQVLDEIRRSPATTGLPVIVLTSADSSETEVEMMERGADDYVRKPIDPPRFVARVKAALRRAGD